MGKVWWVLEEVDDGDLERGERVEDKDGERGKRTPVSETSFARKLFCAAVGASPPVTQSFGSRTGRPLLPDIVVEIVERAIYAGMCVEQKVNTVEGESSICYVMVVMIGLNNGIKAKDKVACTSRS